MGGFGIPGEGKWSMGAGKGRWLFVAGGLAAVLVLHPLRSIAPGQIGIRHNLLTGSATAYGPGSLFVLPGVQELRLLPLAEQVYHPAAGQGSYQSTEGQSVGVDLNVRYALSPRNIARFGLSLPADIDADIIKPELQGVAYRTFTRYTVREIYSSKRTEIQQLIENDLRPRLAAHGIILRGVDIGNINLPQDYRHGLEALLQEELETEKMSYTLQLKAEEVKQRELEAEADKVAQDKAAEAAADQQIIAAKAQEEAMKHVLPFKQKQIEQRQLEAEAAKVARIKSAEGEAQARVIEAGGEATSRRKLADADVYRMEEVGKATSAQMARDGALISQHPLLIQKALADKLSDKISVIIAPPSASGGFIGSGLLGNVQASVNASAGTSADADAGEQ